MNTDYKVSQKTVTVYQQAEFLQKYKTTRIKWKAALLTGNYPMAVKYKLKLDTYRSALGMLGIHIDGVNR